jgi:isoquinoline 1-oxidoreductase beta subunit
MTRTRRAFLIGSASIVGGGLVVGFGYWLHQPGPNPFVTDPSLRQHPFNAYVRVGENDIITVAVPRAEMGQGVRTALAMLVAEELDVPLEKVRVEHPLPSKHYINLKLVEEGLWLVLPHEHGKWAKRWRTAAEFTSGYFKIMQLTGGSSSVRDAWEPMRHAGATARAMLVAAAAETWKVDASRLITEQGKVVDRQLGRDLAYGALAQRAAGIVLAHAVPLKDCSQYRLIGRTTPHRLDTAADKVNGTAKFGIDFKDGEIAYAAVRSVPTLTGVIASYDDASATSQTGVDRVVRVDDRTVAVVANSYWTAQRAVEGLSLTFKNQNTSLSNEAVFADFGRRMETELGFPFRNEGDARARLAASHDVIEAEYQAPYLAHACMEPLNCTARFADGKCTLWLGTQAPGLVVHAVADALCLSSDAVTVNTVLLGGGFGRRLEVDYAVQAARIAKACPGKTVKLIWSREEDMRRDVFRPAARARLTGALDNDGFPEALLARICSQSVTKDFLKRNLGLPLPSGAPDKTNAEGLYDQPYAIPHCRVEHVEAENEVPVGNWRGVGHGFNGFAMECFLDELGRAGGRSPFEVRRHLLQGFPEKLALLDRLETLSRWDAGKRPGIDGRGMAYRQNFNSDVAQVVDVAIEGKQVRVKKVYCVIDCGQPVDCKGIEAQVQSGIVFGLSAALMQAVTVKDGRVQQSNFHRFDALRINQCPEIEIVILSGNPEMGGAGETAVPPVAPALANALFDATGRRVRELPLSASVEVA